MFNNYSDHDCLFLIELLLGQCFRLTFYFHLDAFFDLERMASAVQFSGSLGNLCLLPKVSIGSIKSSHFYICQQLMTLFQAILDSGTNSLLSSGFRKILKVCMTNIRRNHTKVHQWHCSSDNWNRQGKSDSVLFHLSRVSGWWMIETPWNHLAKAERATLYCEVVSVFDLVYNKFGLALLYTTFPIVNC